jgi:hypothetical protein
MRLKALTPTPSAEISAKKELVTMRNLSPLVAALFAAGLIGAPAAIAQNENRPDVQIQEEQQADLQQQIERQKRQELERQTAAADEPEVRTLRGQFVNIVDFVKEDKDYAKADKAKYKADKAKHKADKAKHKDKTTAEIKDKARIKALTGAEVFGFVEEETAVGELLTPENAYIVVMNADSEEQINDMKEKILAHLNRTVEIRAQTFDREGLHVATVHDIEMAVDEDIDEDGLTPEERESL